MRSPFVAQRHDVLAAGRCAERTLGGTLLRHVEAAREMSAPGCFSRVASMTAIGRVESIEPRTQRDPKPPR